MKFSRLLFLLMFCLIISPVSFSQNEDEPEEESESITLPSGLFLSNQMKYSYDYDKELEIFEDWLTLDYRNGIFSTGIRFEMFQPNDPNPSISRGKTRFADIAFKYIKAEIGDIEQGGEITVGNFYTLFGRGMILKSYENRSIRIDNNLIGVKLLGRYNGFIVTALTGMPENSDATRTDLLHAVDLEYAGFNMLRVGGSFASNQPNVDGVARTRLASLRVQPSIWNFDFYGEYGIKQNEDIKQNIFKGEDELAGEAYYLNGSFYYDHLSISGEYKYYDNFAFESYDRTVSYNTPPAVRKEYTYALLNRHPSPLNQQDEKGFAAELNYTFSDETYLSANYGETKTIGPGSYYQKVLRDTQTVRLQLKEAFGQVGHTWNDMISTIAAFGYMEEGSTNTKSITPVLENKFYFDDVNTIKLVLEHQHTTDKTTSEQYYDDVVTVEYLRSPKLSISVVAEMQTKEPEKGKKVRKVWSFISFGYKIGEHTDVSLLVGTRQAGNICIGGVCRYEPEFSGVELKMFTRL